MPLLMLLPLLGFALFLKGKARLADSAVTLHVVSGLLLLLYIGSLLGLLRPTALGLVGLGTVLLLWEIWKHFRKREFRVSVPLLLFLVLPLVFWMVHAESRPMFWDEYSHWGIYVREMTYTHQLWSGETNAAHPYYPPGGPLWQYFFTLPGYGEGAVYLAQFVLLITPLLVFFENISPRQWLWVPAILALLALGLANFGQGIVSLYMDHLLSVWYAGVLLQAMRSDKERLLETGLLSMPLAVILLIKDAGLSLVASATFLIVCLLIYRQFRSEGRMHLNRRLISVTLLLVCIPVAAQMSWKLNREALGVVSRSEGSGLVQVLLTKESTFSEQDLQIYRQHFREVMSYQQLSRNEISQGFNEFGYRLMRLFKEEFRLTLLGLLLLFPLWSVAVVFVSSPPQRAEIGLGLGILYFTALAYIYVMYLTYPLIHSVERAKNLVSFLRYSHTVTLPMLLLGIGMLAPTFQSIRLQVEERALGSRSTLLFGLALALLYAFETPYLKPFYVSATYENHPANYALRWRKDSDAMTEKVGGIVGRKRLWIHLPIQDNGFLATAMRYQMTPTLTTVERSPEFLELSTEKIAGIWKNHDYLWFMLEDPRTSALFEEKMGIPLASHRLARVEAFEDRIRLHPVDLR